MTWNRTDSGSEFHWKSCDHLRFFHTLLYKVISKSTVKDFVTKVYVLELPVKFKLKYFVKVCN